MIDRLIVFTTHHLGYNIS